MCSKEECHACLGKISLVKRVFEELAEKLDRHQGHLIRSTLAGSVFAGAGGALSIIGGALAIATFGASLVLMALGGALGLAGGIISSSASLADMIISKEKKESIQTTLKELLNDPVFKKFVQMQDIPDEFRSDLSFKQKFKRFFSRNKATTAQCAVKATGSSGKGIFKIVDLADSAKTTASGRTVAVAGRTVFRSLSVATKALLVGGVVVDGIFLPLTIYNIVQDSKAIHKRTGSPLGDNLRILVNFFEDIEVEVKANMIAFG